jgi:hypothetical protein
MSNIYLIIFQSGHNISVRIDADHVYIYDGTYVEVGDYLCNSSNSQAWVVKKKDLTAAKAKGIVPIAVIFSITTSNTDKSHGWTRGYALALKDALNNCAWSTNMTTQEQINLSNTNTLAKQNLDGYTETHHIVDNPGNNSTTHPAFFAAVNYKNKVPYPRHSSGWFLPSVGQWYTLCTSLGGMSTTEQLISGNSDYGWKEGSEIFANNINSYFKPLDSNTYTNIPVATAWIRYWSSSEHRIGYGISLEYNSTSTKYFSFDDNKTVTSTFNSRPIIAF